ncbi:MAG: N-acetyltransferase [Dehalococcoidia bacterium]|nr:N-acetyltransferase [Dehalococcoidia bacterium]
MKYTIEKARIEDAVSIQKLINSFADNGEMLARPLSEIYENIRDFFVAHSDTEIIACVALHISWSDMAEVKSLAVSEAHRREGVGEALVKACLEEATSLEIPNIFVLTYVKTFFEKCGFKEVNKSSLPHKIWGECYRCPKFPNCDETAMVYKVK